MSAKLLLLLIFVIIPIGGSILIMSLAKIIPVQFENECKAHPEATKLKDIWKQGICSKIVIAILFMFFIAPKFWLSMGAFYIHMPRGKIFYNWY